MRSMVILQGPSGSGKSTIARALALGLAPNVVVCSADNFFLDAEGVYVFDGSKLAQAHAWCQDRARLALSTGRHSVIVDNTNIRRWEARPYVRMAVEADVPIYFVRATGTHQNVHGVPAERVEAMREALEDLSVQACLLSLAPWEQKVQEVPS